MTRTGPPVRLPAWRVVPRGLHPLAWWVWALGLATAAARTGNPLLLGLVLVVAALVVAARRGDSPWARAFRVYLVLGLVVITIRVVFRALLGAATGTHVLVRLPEIPLPAWAAGIRLGGPVHLEGVLAALYDGLRLATLLCCVGAANALANPKRALRALPGALYEIGVAVVIALTVAPQLVESGLRVRRARRLRGGGRRHRVRSLAMPVLQDALARSLALAAAMDARGYGRTAGVARRVRRLAAGLVIAGLAGLCVGAYGLLDPTVPAVLGLPMLVGGVALCCAGLVAGGRRLHRTSYRPDPWRVPEWVVAGSGVAAAAAMYVAAQLQPATLVALTDPPAWPPLGWIAPLGLLVAALPAVATPPPPRAVPPGAAPPVPEAAGAEPSRRTPEVVG